MPSATSTAEQARACEACGTLAATPQDRYCVVCGKQLQLPEIGPRTSHAAPGTEPAGAYANAPAGAPALQGAPGVLYHQSPSWFPPPSVPPPSADRPTPVGLIVALATVLIAAFAGVAIAIILAVSNGDNITQAPITAGSRTSITVISHAP